MENQENNKDKKKAPRKTVYKEKGEHINEKEPDSGETSSIADLDRSSFTKKPGRTHKPLGTSHEPGTIPGTDI